MDQHALSRIAKVDEVLTQLPREYHNHYALRQDVAALMQTCKTLQPNLQKFSANGRTVTLFYLSGVIPTGFKGATYNIPVTIYFDPPYPQCAPRCFVTPTAEMAVKPNHPFVDSGGMVVNLPWLQNWNQRNLTNFSLQQLVDQLASKFSAQPPVYVKPTGAAAAVAAPAAVVAANPSVNIFAGHQSPVYVAQGPGASQIPVAVARPVQAKPVVEARLVEPQNKEVEKKEVLKQVTQKAKEKWQGVMKPLVDDVNRQLQKKAELEVETEKVDAELKYLRQQVEKNKEHENELKVIEADLRSYVDSQSGPEADPDDIVDSLDTTTQQVLDCLAEELALDEFLVALDELLAAKKISIDDFMKEVRDVSRTQYMCRVRRQKASGTVANEVAPMPVASCVHAEAPAAAAQAFAGAAAATPVAATPVALPQAQAAPPRRQLVPA